VLAVRARGGSANDGRAMGSVIDECVTAIPPGCKDRYRLWIRVDSAGYQDQVLSAAERHDAHYTVTVKQVRPALAAMHALALDPATEWSRRSGTRAARAARSRRPRRRCWGAPCG
jgi:hypothetical protein